MGQAGPPQPPCRHSRPSSRCHSWSARCQFTPAPGETNDFHVRSFYFSAPNLPGAALYTQINSGPQRTVYRQRVTLLSENPDGTITGRSFAFVDPARFVDAWDKGDALHALTPGDLTAGFEAMPGSSCDMIWRRSGEASWEGRIS
ncbi:MAG: CpcT/CpeT family chromophore lyase, partial [Hyphomonadaceae bacterium]|nr:CpcT/CpeT family chromophore lyase [Hyphomonadaceae bacterium]